MNLNDQSNIYNFEIGDELSDIKLLVSDKTYFVHKAILATASPVFKRMFISDFLERSSSQIPLPDKNAEEILELLKIIYPTHASDFDENKVDALLALSEEYDMIKVRKIVEKHLLKQLNDMNGKRFYGNKINSHVDYLVYLIRISCQYRLKNLKLKAIEHVANHIEKEHLERNEYFVNQLETDIKLEVLNMKLDLINEKYLNREKLFKQMQDDLLKQKFEIKRLNSLIDHQ